jgi:peroxiredoxin Q/BCP
MEAYRDQYATLFNGGKNVTLIGISVDPDTALISWMKDANFPFVFASDGDGAVGTLYGAYLPANRVDNRSLYVIGPDGRIAYKAQPFRQSSADAYTQLEAEIDKLSPPAAGKP